MGIIQIILFVTVAILSFFVEIVYHVKKRESFLRIIKHFGFPKNVIRDFINRRRQSLLVSSKRFSKTDPCVLRSKRHAICDSSQEQMHL